MPDVDLVGAEVTPFNVAGQAGALPQKVYNPYDMAQQPGTQVVTGEGSGQRGSDIRSSTTGSHYPTTITGQSVGMHNTDFRGPSPGPSLGTSGTLPSSKEMSEGGRFQVANGGNGEGGSGLVQHRDAGRLRQGTVVEEIPPSYDSISPDDRPSAGRA